MTLNPKQSISILAGLFVGLFVLLLFLPEIPAPASYHDFADKRRFIGIPNFFDVLTNLPFLVIGLWGLFVVLNDKNRSFFLNTRAKIPLVLFFSGLPLVFLGSCYYHLAPSEGPLLWDRIPIVLAFSALFSVFVSDRIDIRIGLFYAMPLLMALSLLSLTWHHMSLPSGGDLRFYILVQLYPIMALPLLCRIRSPNGATTEKHLWKMIVWYGFAKILELGDHIIFSATDGLISGHSLKHLASATAAAMVVFMIKEKARPVHEERASQNNT